MSVTCEHRGRGLPVPCLAKEARHGAPQHSIGCDPEEPVVMAAERYFGPEQGKAWVAQLGEMVSSMVRVTITPDLDRPAGSPDALSQCVATLAISYGPVLTSAAIPMAEAAHLREIPIAEADASNPPRHSAVVRITHWITAVSVFVLLLSGIAILLAHPRLYWGETGAREGPSLIDLPLPFVLDVPIRGPGRYLHFTFAWVCVLTGLFYGLFGLFSRHFRKHLLPTRDSLSWRLISRHLRLTRPTEEEALSYNVVQRLSYLGVVFVLFPLIIWTGLAMSPAVTSVFPWLATVLGGQQSARTIHFFTTIAIVLFVLVHVAMVFRAGFASRTWPMITGRLSARPRSKPSHIEEEGS